MVRYGMYIDLEKCVGCQTCAMSCKVNNKTPNGVFFNQTNDYEKGEFPAVDRQFLPVQCNQCDDPKCVSVCPADATFKTDSGVVTIDSDACTGCKSCMVACPYGARTYLEEDQEFDETDTFEKQLEEANEMGTVTKCDFCIDKVQDGREEGLTPGEDPDATPYCVSSCIGDARVFGDLDDDDSKVARLVEEEDTEPLQPEAGTDPNIYYKR
jgi:phenylacetyl-CoA:acceptor oxidoreductase subunit 1